MVVWSLYVIVAGCYSAEGAKNVSWRLRSLLWGWGSPTMTFTDKFVYMAHHFILLRLNPFGLRVDSEESWFEHSMSWFRVWLSAEGAENVSWPWVPPLRGCCGLTITFTGKFLYMSHDFILLWLNPFGLRVDRKGWWFVKYMSWLRICLSGEAAKNVLWPWLSPLWRWGSLSITFNDNF